MGSIAKGVEGFVNNVFGLETTNPAANAGLNTAQNMAVGNLQAIGPQQQEFAKMLAQNAMGQGKSIAEAQLQAAMNKNLQQQIAASKGNRALNPALASRQNAIQAGKVQQQTAESAAIARMQEQQQQQQAFQNYITSQQNTAIGAGSEVAKNELEQQKRNDALFSGMMESGASAAAMLLSDKKTKKDIKSGTDSTQEFLDALKSYDFKYKDEKGGPQNGVMAQDLEKTKAGAQMVKETPQGKMIDPVKGFGAVLAAQAQLNERLKALESKKGKK